MEPPFGPTDNLSPREADDFAAGVNSPQSTLRDFSAATVATTHIQVLSPTEILNGSTTARTQESNSIVPGPFPSIEHWPIYRLRFSSAVLPLRYCHHRSDQGGQSHCLCESCIHGIDGIFLG